MDTGPKYLKLIEGGGHRNSAPGGGMKYLDAVSEFVSSVRQKQRFHRSPDPFFGRLHVGEYFDFERKISQKAFESGRHVGLEV